ncbi:DUF2835 family protein [Paraglaciecola aestuariivivens]
MQTFYFSLSLEYDYCERLYYPNVNTVVVTAENGKRVQLPAKNLRPFVSPLGIKGRFRLIIDDHHKIQSFERVA